MKVVCAGYRRLSGQIVPCGKVLREIKGEGVSHGICDECFEKMEKVIEKWRGKNDQA